MTLREPRPEQFGLLLVGKIHLDHRVGGSIVGVAEHGKIKPVMVEPFAHRTEHVGEIGVLILIFMGCIGHTPRCTIRRERIVSLSRRSPEAGPVMRYHSRGFSARP